MVIVDLMGNLVKVLFVLVYLVSDSFIIHPCTTTVALTSKTLNSYLMSDK